MSRTIWKKGPLEERVEHEASETLNRLGDEMYQLSQSENVRGNPGLLDTALLHWETCRHDLSLTMNSVSGQDVLETFFSFQPNHVQIFINTEGAYPEDIDLKILPEEGGFDLTVRHKDLRSCKARNLSALRLVHRSYRFIRQLFWNKVEFTLRQDGILQLIIPGPQLNIHPIPFRLF